MNSVLISQDGSQTDDDGKLIIVTDSQVLAIKLHRCNNERITSCRLVVKDIFIYHPLKKSVPLANALPYKIRIARGTK